MLLELFEVVVLFRLAPGHTHEDIHAMFGEMWVASSEKYIMTPKEQEDVYMNVLRQGNHGGKARLDDIVVLPDYDRWLRGKRKADKACE